MHAACYFGPLDLALLLISFGGNVHLADDNGRTPLNYCDSGYVKLSARAIETAHFYAPSQNWLRRKGFVAFRSAIYGSTAFQAMQQLLPVNEREKEVNVISTHVRAWKVIDKVFGNSDLCRGIASFL
jgi:hypothetical protein